MNDITLDSYKTRIITHIEDNIKYISYTISNVVNTLSWELYNSLTITNLRNQFINDIINNTSSSMDIILSRNIIPIENNKLNKNNYILLRKVPDTNSNTVPETIYYVMKDAAYCNRGVYLHLSNSQKAEITFNNEIITFTQINENNFKIEYNDENEIEIYGTVGKVGNIVIKNNTLKYIFGSIILESDESRAQIIKMEVDGYIHDNIVDNYLSGSIYPKIQTEKAVNLNLLTQHNIKNIYTYFKCSYMDG